MQKERETRALRGFNWWLSIDNKYDTSILTRPKKTAGHSIIDLTQSTPDLGFLPAWVFDEDYATLSDHEFITFGIKNLDEMYGNISSSKEFTVWAFKDVNNEMEIAVKIQRETLSKTSAMVTISSSQAELYLEAQWIIDTLTHVFNYNFGKLRVCAWSKRWWTNDL